MVKKSKKIVQQELWEKELIPNESLLYCYVHKSNINNLTQKPLERAFRNTPFDTGVDLSADWNKYSTPKKTLNRLSKQINAQGKFKNPKDYLISQLNVGIIRKEIPSQKIEHDPIQNHHILPDNRSHSKIIGEKDPEIRLKLVDISEWIIAPF